ncbi:MAG: FlgD immunoglobulin-like domain containing protein [Candidatus Eisenbacteria bacterium]
MASMLLMAWALSPFLPAAPAGAHPLPGDSDPTDIRTPPTASVLARYDLDHDGKLNAAEKAAFLRDLREKVAPMRRAAIKEFDWNHNGILDSNESLAQKRARAEQHARSEARALAKYDANRNGTLDPAEQSLRKSEREVWLARKKSQILARNDADRNGVLDAGEKSVIRSRYEAGRATAIQRYDSNGDGRLDAAERAAGAESERTRQVSPVAGNTGLQSQGVKMTAATGGEVAAVGGVARLAVPAGALSADGRVTVTSAAVLESGHGGRQLVRVVDVAWNGAALRKSATLEIAAVAGVARPGAGALVIGRWTGHEWQELRSTPGADRTAAQITEDGRYALMEPVGAPTGAATLSNVRVIAATGMRNTRGAEIGFALGRAGAVTVKVFDTAGRMIRNVTVGTVLGAGEHTVRWDGSGADGRQVSIGLYMISVEALGQKATRKLPVVR